VAPAPKQTVLVVVHGVGAIEPSNMVRELCGELAGPVTIERIGGHDYPKLTPSDERQYKSAYELYWADLKPRGNGRLARLGRPLHVMLALSQIGAEGWGDGKLGINGYSHFGDMLHGFMWGFALSLSAIYFPLFHMTVLPPSTGFPAAVLSILPGVALALSLRTLDISAGFSVYLTLALGVASILAGYSGWVTPSMSAEIAAGLLSSIYLAVIGLTSLALAELTKKTWKASARPPLRCYLVRFAALTLPFTLLGGGLGALSWALNLWISVKFGPGHLSDWNNAYIAALPFDLALLELAFAAATFAFGAVFAIAGVVYFLRLKFGPTESLSKNLGQFLRNSIIPALLVLAIGNTIVSALYLVNVLAFPNREILQFPPLRYLSEWFVQIGVSIVHIIGGEITDQPGTAITAFSVYAASSTRIVSFIPSMLGKLRQPAAIVADVVLWLAPEGPLSYRSKARRRLTDLVSELGSKFNIQVLAHSQGTVIALDALRYSSRLNLDLITAGSPVDTLYKEFLAVELPRPPCIGTWANFYRLSDYVGGPVSIAGNNILIAEDYRMNHLNYFHAEQIVWHMSRMAESLEERSAPLLVNGRETVPE
jgi:hypothetical protein